MKHVLLFSLFLHTCLFSMAGTFTSNGTGPWNNPGTWIVVGDANGIPDTDDDITILSGHQITVVSGINGYCRNLTVNIGGTITINSAVLYINGDYQNDGAETSSGSVSFKSPGTEISGSGTFGQSVRYTFANTRNIQAGTTITKNVNVRFLDNAVINNSGTLSLATVINGTNVTFTNTATGSLTLRASGFLTGSGNVFNANASGNSVTVQYNSATIPTASASTYHHLTINGTTVSQSTSTIVNGNFTVNGSRSFNMNGQDLVVSGNFANSGTISNGSTRTLTLNSATTQNFSSSTAFSIGTLNISSGTSATMTSGIVNVVSTLDITTAATLNINGGATLTLVSDATSTARIDQLHASANITGNITVQRFISARTAGYSDMSSPVQGSTFADWDNELLFVYGYNPPDQFPSAWGYSETAWDYVAITSAATALTPGLGYEVYLDSDGSQTTFNATTVNTIGTPNYGDIDVSGQCTLVNDGWNLVGNPYASHINFSTFRTASGGTINATWMFYDEAIEDFQSISGGTVEPHGGFWIEVNSGSPTVLFQENQKTSSTSSSYRSGTMDKFNIRLESNGLTRFTSNTQFVFGDFSKSYVNGEDVTFMKVPHPDAPALYSMVDNKRLRVNYMQQEDEQHIPLFINVSLEGLYTLSASNIEMAELAGYSCVILEDRKTGQRHDLRQSGYVFEASSMDADRFVLHLSNNGCEKIAPVTSLDDFAEINKNANGTFVAFNFEETNAAAISVVNLLGQPIIAGMQVEAKDQVIYLAIPESFSGIYLVNVQVGDKIITRKFFKE